jgi:rhodanese-related sulfurtransferase
LKLNFLWWLPFGSVPEITTEQLHRWLEEGRPVQLVDSRTGLEFGQGSLNGAQHAPVTELPGAIDRLDLDPQRPVVLLCLSGHRSRPGTRLLRARGFEAYSLEGGIMAWRQAGYLLEGKEP